MIESVHGTEPEPGSPLGGVVSVQYDQHGGDIGLGISLRRAALEEYLASGRELPPNTDVIVFYARLERPATNRLIRLLRKARDTAFGADA